MCYGNVLYVFFINCKISGKFMLVKMSKNSGWSTCTILA